MAHPIPSEIAYDDKREHQYMYAPTVFKEYPGLEETMDPFWFDVADTLHKLSHRNLIGLAGCGLDGRADLDPIDGHPDIRGPWIMYVNTTGRTLADAADDLTREQAEQIMQKLVSAVGALHEVGYSQDTITEHSVIIDEAGEPVITELGWKFNTLFTPDADVEALKRIAALLPLGEYAQEQVAAAGTLDAVSAGAVAVEAAAAAEEDEFVADEPEPAVEEFPEPEVEEFPEPIIESIEPEEPDFPEPEIEEFVADEPQSTPKEEHDAPAANIAPADESATDEGEEPAAHADEEDDEDGQELSLDDFFGFSDHPAETQDNEPGHDPAQEPERESPEGAADTHNEEPETAPQQEEPAVEQDAADEDMAAAPPEEQSTPAPASVAAEEAPVAEERDPLDDFFIDDNPAPAEEPAGKQDERAAVDDAGEREPEASEVAAPVVEPDDQPATAGVEFAEETIADEEPAAEEKPQAEERTVAPTFDEPVIEDTPVADDTAPVIDEAAEDEFVTDEPVVEEFVTDDTPESHDVPESAGSVAAGDLPVEDEDDEFEEDEQLVHTAPEPSHPKKVDPVNATIPAPDGTEEVTVLNLQSKSKDDVFPHLAGVHAADPSEVTPSQPKVEDEPDHEREPEQVVEQSGVEGEHGVKPLVGEPEPEATTTEPEPAHDPELEHHTTSDLLDDLDEGYVYDDEYDEDYADARASKRRSLSDFFHRRTNDTPDDNGQDTAEQAHDEPEHQDDPVIEPAPVEDSADAKHDADDEPQSHNMAAPAAAATALGAGAVAASKTAGHHAPAEPAPAPQQKPAAGLEPEQDTTPREVDKAHESEYPRSRRKFAMPAMPAKVSRRGVLIGAGAGLLGLGLLGGVAAMNKGDDEKSAADASGQKPQNTFTAGDSEVGIIKGFSSTAAWKKSLPETANVFGSAAAVAFVEGATMTLYSTAKGEKIRDVKLDGDLALLRATDIDGDPAILWSVKDSGKLFAWSEKIGAKGDLIEEKIGKDASVTTNGSQPLIVDGNKSYTLTRSGKKEITSAPKDKFSIAVDDGNLISGEYDLPVTLTPVSGGQSKDVTLKAPKEGQAMHKWLSAGYGHAILLWSSDPLSSDDNTAVSVALHSLKDGSVVGQYDSTLGELKDQKWVIGQGGDKASYGHAVFSLAESKLLGVTPDKFPVTSIRGFNVLSTPDKSKQRTMVFPGGTDEEGYWFNGTLLAITPDGAVTQKGGEVAVYPSTLS